MWQTLNESLSNICSSPFWNTNLTWHSADPDFTICFEKTILVWLPCTFLWLFSLLEIHFLKTMTRPFGIYFNWYNVCKLTIISILGTISLIDVGNHTLFDGKHILVDIIASISKFFTFILFFGLTYANIERGIRSSGILFTFSLLLALCSVVQFRTEWKSISGVSKWTSNVDDSDERIINAILGTVSFYIYHSGTILVLLLNCFADLFPAVEAKTCKEEICPENDSSILSKISFSWFNSIVWRGYKRPLNAGDVWEVDDELKTERISSRFEKRWNLALSRSRRCEDKRPKVRYEETKLLKDGIDPRKLSSTKKTSILRPLCETFGPHIMIGYLWYSIFIISNFLSPVILKQIIGFAERKNEYLWRGILYVFLLLATATSQSLLINQHAHVLCRCGLQIRTALQSIIYKKALRISNGGRKEFTLGEVSNLIAVDTQRFLDFILFSAMLFSFPLVVSIGLYFLWELLGSSALASIVTLATIILVSYIIATKLKNKRNEQMKYKDERIKLINEIISGIRVLKLNAWEPSFEKLISRIRQKETAILKSIAYLQTLSFFLSSAAPFLVFFVTFGVYTLSSDSNVMDAQTVFVSLAVFNILRAPLSRFPVLVEYLMQVSVSIKRIDKYLNAEDLAQDSVSHEACDDPVLIEDGQFSWDGYEAPSPVLSNINLRVKSGDLVAVVGPVGSGKSSLLGAILGEMYKQFGRVNTTGKLAYVPQQAWIRNTTLRDNVTFEGEINHSFYARILEACSLMADLKTLPGGDQAEIGEKGINLSGGQKQRVSLARAIYANSDIYLLDDPLSAVDSHVGKHIFEEVIGPNGLLKNKTRIWVTHNLNYLPQVDNIIVLQNGTISETGTYKELLDKKEAFANFLTTYHKEEDDTISAPKEIHNIAQATNTQPDNAVKGTSDQKVVGAVGQKLIEEEISKTGNVKWQVYKCYLKAIGMFLLIVTLSMNVMYQIFSIATNYWLSVWTNDHTMMENNQEKTIKQYRYLGVYALFGLLESSSATIMAISAYLGILKASNRTHDSSFSSVLRWPTTLFDKIPLGRIINRFSFDMDILDSFLGQKVVQSLYHTAGILTSLFVVSYSTPLSMIVIAPVAALYFFVQRFFIVTSRQLKRLESVSQSPIYSHMQETVTGTQSIRAYGLQSEFTKLLENKIDFNQKSSYASIVSRRWLAIRMEFMGNMIVFTSALFAVLSRDSLSAGLIGLSLIYASQITFKMFLWMQIWCELETNIVAIERLQEYIDFKQEAAWKISNENIPYDWPSRGEIAFQDFQVRYQEGLELVLKGISFSVEKGEKIGIVGRTGSGKSSLTLSLFRIIEPAGGKILIDGVDISKIGLHTLRGHLTIIAQDPVLFSGTLRINLDPTEQHSDDDLWRALELANLKTFVSNLSFGLQHEVTEGGSNFSVGQRQLICLARAVLRKSKLLVLDEATASVDMETDDHIQTTIRKEFKDCTILTIAHRLHTILDYDRIIVLDSGRIVEFDSPNELLSSKESHFYKMATDAGIV